MRIRSGRYVAALFFMGAAYGCYSSVAAEPKIDDTDSPDSELPVDPASGLDACSPRKPWEGPGVTGVLPLSATEAYLFNGENYFTVEFDTASGDASDRNVGKVLAWHEKGLVEDLWPNAPPIDGYKPWDDNGITATYIAKGGAQVIISRYRRWVHSGKEWPAAGSIVQDFVINDAGPPLIDGQAPWQGAGATSTYFIPGGEAFLVISQDKVWERDTPGTDQRNWTWTDGGSFMLSEVWSGVTRIGGQRPYEGKGVTATWYVGGKFFVVSGDRMWTHDGVDFTAVGYLKDQPGWSSAPASACKR